MDSRERKQKIRPVDLTKLAENEVSNFQKTTEHLGPKLSLLRDMDSLYAHATLLLKSTGGSIASDDETLMLVCVIHELMICRLLLMKAGLACLRLYQDDTLTHLRRAIEVCAFSVRMSKHHELSRVWAEGALDQQDARREKYDAYRRAFKTWDVFPKAGHPDYNPILTDLKKRFDNCSKVIHGSIFGLVNHVTKIHPDDPQYQRMTFFDLQTDLFVPTYFYLLQTHDLLLELFGTILEPYMTDVNEWHKEHRYVHDKLSRHYKSWSDRQRRHGQSTS